MVGVLGVECRSHEAGLVGSKEISGHCDIRHIDSEASAGNYQARDKYAVEQRHPPSLDATGSLF